MLIVASLSDLSKPASHISLNQNLALAATGIIWSRYATQITPVNWNLFAVNVFVFLSSGYQLYRIFKWKQEQKALEAQNSVTEDENL